MPRTARIKSVSGYYHIIARGIGKQVLFEDDEDHIFFLKMLKTYASEGVSSVIAFCLMENHVHLLMKVDEGMDRFMQKLQSTYAAYYNKKYDRTGHLYQDRYRSKPIESDSYLLTAVRYIHNNPVKAGICPADRYRWSSWRCYSGDIESFVDTEYVLRLIGGREGFLKYSSLNCSDEEDDGYFEYENARKSDNTAMSVIHDVLHLESGTKIQKMDRINRDKCLKLLRDQGLSIRQIERLTGIPRSIIMRAGM